MTSLLEQKRMAKEEQERCERRIASLLVLNPKTHKERLVRDHQVNNLMHESMRLSETLVSLFRDEDGLQKREIEAMGGTENPFSSFYDKLRGLREKHRNSAGVLDPVEAITVIPLEDDEADAETAEKERIRKEMRAMLLGTDMQSGGDHGMVDVNHEPILFSGEETLGRYLDLTEPYETFVAWSGLAGELSYLEYVSTFAHFHTIAPYAKDARFVAYVEQLLHYLVSFIERSQPLLDVPQMLLKVVASFGARWDEGKLPGWEAHGEAHLVEAAVRPVVDLASIASASELEALGMDTLKAALTAAGLKCGGTLAQRAVRLFGVKGVAWSDVPRKHFAKSVLGRRLARKHLDADGMRTCALLECKVHALAEVLADQVEATKANVEKKQTRTREELEAEREAEEEGAMDDMDDDEDDEEEFDPVKANLKNLPLGPDGKPIPYWLYKLHGLNLEYKCEICGNASYFGPRNFEKHFHEWRHNYGMRCLGIPNSKEFFNVVLIEDARALHAKLKKETGSQNFRPEEEEEFEDADGNVFSKKTFEMLKKQGLVKV